MAPGGEAPLSSGANISLTLAGFSAAWSRTGRAVFLEFEGLNTHLKFLFAFPVRVPFIDRRSFPVNGGSVKFSSKINFKFLKKEFI